jgi:capsule polysaccharide export protein KpsE/RkpR
MSKEPKKPSESLVQELLAERRDLKVALERVRLELDDVRSTSGRPDPRVRDLTAEVERLRYQLAHSRAEVGLLREERDELRAGVERVMEQLGKGK